MVTVSSELSLCFYTETIDITSLSELLQWITLRSAQSTFRSTLQYPQISILGSNDGRVPGEMKLRYKQCVSCIMCPLSSTLMEAQSRGFTIWKIIKAGLFQSAITRTLITTQCQLQIKSRSCLHSQGSLKSKRLTL